MYLKKLFDYEWTMSDKVSKISKNPEIKYTVRIRNPENLKTFFFLKCIIANIFCVANFTLEWFLLWAAFMK